MYRHRAALPYGCNLFIRYDVFFLKKRLLSLCIRSFRPPDVPRHLVDLPGAARCSPLVATRAKRRNGSLQLAVRR